MNKIIIASTFLAIELTLLATGLNILFASETVYMKCEGNISGYNLTITPDADVLPLDIIPNAKEIYPGICHVLLDDSTLSLISEATGIQDPRSLESMTILGIGGQYIGKTRQGVLNSRPDLVGILPEHAWFGVPDRE